MHLGDDCVVKEQEVVGIFDIDRTTTSNNTREFLKTAQKAGAVVNVTNELPRGFVVCAQPGKKDKVYITRVSAKTILKRLEMRGRRN